jgi:8-oxo-dGTP pyrophosphatase MutT (NUDIX family)
MYELITRGPQIVKEASKTPLGFSATVVLLLSIVALVLFAGQSGSVLLIAFSVMLVAVLSFAVAIVQVTSRSNASSPFVPADAGELQVVGKVEPTRRPRASQAAAVCYRFKGERLEFLLIRSSVGRRLFPKGSPKEGEELWETAKREAREEAGAIGKLRTKPLTRFWQHKGRKKKSRREISVDAFLLEVSHWQDEDEEEREPKWYEPGDAERAFTEDWRKEDAREYQRVIRLARDEIAGDAIARNR